MQIYKLSQCEAHVPFDFLLLLLFVPGSVWKSVSSKRNIQKNQFCSCKSTDGWQSVDCREKSGNYCPTQRQPLHNKDKWRMRWAKKTGSKRKKKKKKNADKSSERKGLEKDLSQLREKGNAKDAGTCHTEKKKQKKAKRAREHGTTEWRD